MLPDLPGNFDNKVTDVSQLNLEADESEMIVCYTTSTTNNEETAEGNIDETEEKNNTEQDDQRVDIVECKKRLREAYETIRMYEVPLDDLDRKLYRQIRTRLVDSCAELNKSKEQTDIRSYFTNGKYIWFVPLNRIVIAFKLFTQARYTKIILNDCRIINPITAFLLKVKIDTYNNAVTEWRNGTCRDVLYLFEVAFKNPLSLILIEVQQNVNELFMRRLMMYSLNVVSTHIRSSLPIVLIFCINKVIPQALLAKFTPLPDMPWIKSFPCDLLLYKISKNVAIEDNIYEANFATQVDTICSTNHNILSKAKKALKNIPNTQRACRILNRGLKYNLKVKRKLMLLESTSDSSLDYPDNLPMASVCASPSTDEKEKAFIKRFRKNHVGKINWKLCLEQVHSEGLFKRYSTGDSLRTNYDKHVIQNTVPDETHS
ncbi:hypothetical protein G6F43_011440 [Rhizopus delemar]|nr:hypothetical protein G6F43_011440 [Rhizopus delemar]